MGRWQRYDLKSSAECLDGSPAAFYFRPPRDGNSTARSFVLFMEGGGWCNSPADCVSRTRNIYGSSSSYSSSSRSPGVGAGYFDEVSSLGSEFASSGLVFLKYCDATSFAGGGALTLLAKSGSVLLGRRRINQGERFTVRFSGRVNLMATLRMLLADAERFGLSRASEVLLSGCSAGGLAALLNADLIHRTILASGAPLAKFKVMVFSGIFHSPLSSAYTHQMRHLFRFSNMSAPDTCTRRHPREPWRCVLGLEPLESLPPHISAFVEQSALDRWQTGCVLAAERSHFEVVKCGSKSASWESW